MVEHAKNYVELVEQRWGNATADSAQVEGEDTWDRLRLKILGAVP